MLLLLLLFAFAATTTPRPKSAIITSARDLAATGLPLTATVCWTFSQGEAH
jgi:hypothetical protein